MKISLVIYMWFSAFIQLEKVGADGSQRYIRRVDDPEIVKIAQVHHVVFFTGSNTAQSYRHLLKYRWLLAKFGR
jgi:hypothetical protein